MDEEMDDEVSTVAMQVILNAGNGRDKTDKALDAMASFDFDAAKSYLDEAEKDILKAHAAQTGMIQRQAAGEKFAYSILFVHAQDTLMTIDAQLHSARKMLAVFAALYAEIQAK